MLKPKKPKDRTYYGRLVSAPYVMKPISTKKATTKVKDGYNK